MAIVSYTHIEIHPQGGSFSLLTGTENSRKTDKLETLARIERILREKLVCTTEKYAILPRKTLHNFLRDLSIEIVHSHISKTEMLPWYQRIFQARESANIQATAQRVLNLVHPPRIFAKLPQGVLSHISRYLTVQEIAGLSLINKDGAAQATRAKIRRAREFGWQGADPAKADGYLRSFLPFITMVEKYVVRRGSPWKLDVESTLKALQKNKPSIPAALDKIATEYQNGNNPELLKTALLLCSQGPHCNPEEILHLAARLCFEEGVSLALSLGAHVNRNVLKAPPLSWALATHPHRPEEEIEKTVEILLSAGASASIRADNGSLPIHFATQSGYAKMVGLLLQRGADVNCRGHQGCTPLIWALKTRPNRSEEEIEKTAETLLGAGASISIPADNGSLPIHFAAESGYAKMVGLLLQHGADVNCQGYKGCTSLILALLIQPNRSEEEIEKTVERLLSAGASLSIPAENGNLPIHFAAQSGYAKMVGLLLQHGADVNCQGYKGLTPLSWALETSSVLLIRPNRSEEEIEKTVEMLLDAGANPSIPDDNGSLSIHFAAESCYAKMVGLLLQRGADVNCQGKGGLTPLHCALRALSNRSEEEIEKTVETLLDAGANLSIPDDDGSLPIHFAAELGCAKMVGLLIQRGADVNCQGWGGLTPLSRALQSTRSEEEVEKTVETLLNAGASVSIPADNGSLPIHFAAQSGYAKIVGLLLQRGVDVNCQGGGGRTSLSWALESTRSEEEIEKTVETLLKAGANPNILDKNGDAPLHWAARGGRKGALSLLLLYGADPTLLNNQGKAPWEVAKDQASADLCKI